MEEQWNGAGVERRRYGLVREEKASLSHTPSVSLIISICFEKTLKTQAPVTTVEPILAHPSHAAWPYTELHRRPKGLRPHGDSGPFWLADHTFRGPIGSPAEGSSGCVRMVTRITSRTPLARFVDPWGAPPKAPVAAFAC